MKYHEIAAQSKEALQATLRERRRHLDQLRFKVADDTNKNVRELRAVRKEIAQIMTALNKKVDATGVAASAAVKPVVTLKAATGETATTVAKPATPEKK